MSFIAPLPAVASGFLLVDPRDPRYESLMSFRDRFAKILHAGVAVVESSGEQAGIDTVKMTVRSIGTVLLKYGLEAKTTEIAHKGYSYLEKQGRSWAKQKTLPRYVWARRGDL